MKKNVDFKKKHYLVLYYKNGLLDREMFYKKFDATEFYNACDADKKYLLEAKGVAAEFRETI